MVSPIRLGGFKVLKDVGRISLNKSISEKNLPEEFCNLLSEDKINLAFLTCANEDQKWGLHTVIDFENTERASHLISQRFRKVNRPSTKDAILSIFPHKSDPEIVATFFNALGDEGIQPKALAYSHSAISVVVPEETLNQTAGSLFGPFSFSAYRTPSDWKLAQKGKEQLYKEVVASYQEKKPSVYGLEWQDEQGLIKFKLTSRNLKKIGLALKDLAQIGLQLNFMISKPSETSENPSIIFCIPKTPDSDYIEIVQQFIPDATETENQTVAVFTMNGPHFGDRYGIAGTLLNSLNSSQIDLLALSCSVASISGVVPSNQIHTALQAIKTCFEVPSVFQRNATPST